MIVQPGLCQTWSEPKLLVFPTHRLNYKLQTHLSTPRLSGWPIEKLLQGGSSSTTTISKIRGHLPSIMITCLSHSELLIEFYLYFWISIIYVCDFQGVGGGWPLLLIFIISENRKTYFYHTIVFKILQFLKH